MIFQFGDSITTHLLTVKVHTRYNTHIRICICMCVYIYIYIHTYMRIFLSLSIYISLYMRIHIYICVYIYIYIYIYISLSKGWVRTYQSLIMRIGCNQMTHHYNQMTSLRLTTKYLHSLQEMLDSADWPFDPGAYYQYRLLLGFQRHSGVQGCGV